MATRCRLLEELPECPGFHPGFVYFATPGDKPKTWHLWKAAGIGSNAASPDFYQPTGAMVVNVAESKLAEVGKGQVELRVPAAE